MIFHGGSGNILQFYILVADILAPPTGHFFFLVLSIEEMPPELYLTYQPVANSIHFNLIVRTGHLAKSIVSENNL